ncbi:hypothetical protein FJZ26_00420 [Candidatus Parvarchaeota archaeon]|nr:hypothetical protein [Candidatus Parvarchaeota archaeon]
MTNTFSESKSVFLDFFGDKPNFRVIDFLLENRLRDFTKTEIAKGANISWATLFNYWEELEKHRIVKLTRVVGRAKLYQLNESEPVVKQLKAIEIQLVKQAAMLDEEKIAVKASAKKTKPAESD